jgi:hypothetical protein
MVVCRVHNEATISLWQAFSSSSSEYDINNSFVIVNYRYF